MPAVSWRLFLFRFLLLGWRLRLLTPALRSRRRQVGMSAYDWLIVCSVMILITSLLGFWGACRTNKRTRRRLGILMIYNWVLVVVAACCVWVGIMCFIFASRADYYVQRYWASIRSVLDVPIDTSLGARVAAAAALSAAALSA